MKYDLHHGDCLEVMKTIPDSSIDMILCDLPYGTTTCTWDIIIPFDKLWEQYERIIKPNHIILLFGSEPFSSMLRLSNLKSFKYDWYWRKSRPSGFVNAKLKPLKDIETISIFSSGTTANRSKNNTPYYPQNVEECNIKWSRPNRYLAGDPGVNPARKNSKLNTTITKRGYPRQILDFPNSNHKLIHPTQKPLELIEYLIKTYTKKEDLILDNCMGSGVTGVGCINTDRNFIGIELNEKYFTLASNRIGEIYENKIL